MDIEIKGSVILDAVWWKDPPEVVAGLDDVILYQGQLQKETKISFDQKSRVGSHRIWVKFVNKRHDDTNVHTGQDKAVLIKQIEFFGIQSPRFVWAGVYEPQYPQSWVNHLQQQGKIAESHLRYHDYLGWNGIWYLDFSLPIFTWIHQIENLGWVYD